MTVSHILKQGCLCGHERSRNTKQVHSPNYSGFVEIIATNHKKIQIIYCKFV